MSSSSTEEWTLLSLLPANLPALQFNGLSLGLPKVHRSNRTGHNASTKVKNFSLLIQKGLLLRKKNTHFLFCSASFSGVFIWFLQRRRKGWGKYSASNIFCSLRSRYRPPNCSNQCMSVNGYCSRYLRCLSQSPMYERPCEGDKCCKTLWGFSEIEKSFINARQSTIYHPASAKAQGYISLKPVMHKKPPSHCFSLFSAKGEVRSLLSLLVRDLIHLKKCFSYI